MDQNTPQGVGRPTMMEALGALSQEMTLGAGTGRIVALLGDGGTGGGGEVGEQGGQALGDRARGA